MTRLPKHLQPRHRYLAVGIESWPDAAIDHRSFQGQLWEAARDLVGDAGSAAVDLTVVRFEFEDGDGDAVVRTHRDEVSPARAVIACIDAIDDQPVGVWVRGTSGTIRSCEEKYIGERPEALGERKVVFRGATRAAVERDGRLDVRIDDAFTGATELDLE